MQTKQITVTVSVPEGDYCDSVSVFCDFWYRDHDGPGRKCYCILFNMTKLDQRHKENTVAGLDVLKCEECKRKCNEG